MILEKTKTYTVEIESRADGDFAISCFNTVTQKQSIVCTRNLVELIESEPKIFHLLKIKTGSDKTKFTELH